MIRFSVWFGRGYSHVGYLYYFPLSLSLCLPIAVYIGFLMVSFSFPFIFIRCFGCPAAGTWTEFGYYVPFIVVLQIGWACAQISHLALIGHLTSVQSEKTELVSYRCVMTLNELPSRTCDQLRFCYKLGLCIAFLLSL